MANPKIALITGASSGIGKALAYEFAKRQYDLILVARRAHLLMELALELKNKYGVDSTVLVVDLSQADAAKQIAQAVEEKQLIVDALVNNAGLGAHGAFAESELSRIDEMLQVNIKTLVDLTRYFLPSMLKRNHGYILNVASTAGMQPIPSMAVYAATKAFVISFTRAVAAECDGKKIYMTALCPGPVLTEFAQRANMADATVFNAPILDIMQAGQVAKIGIQALFSNKRVCIAGWRNRLLIILGMLVPVGISIALTRRFMQKR